MADDITLTVRVRDLSRGELTRVNQQVNRLRTNFRNAGNSANSTSRSFRTLGQDIGRLTGQFRQMAQSGNLTQRSFQRMSRDIDLVNRGLRTAVRNGDITRARFRAMSRDVDLLRARMILLGRQGNVFTRASAGLLIMQDRLRRSTQHAGTLQRTFGRMGDWGLGGMRRASTGLALLTGLMGRLGRAINMNRRWTAILIASLVLIGPIAQALGALLVTVLGGAFIALGAFALRGNQQVKTAFQQMKSTVGSSVREAAAPLKDSLVAAMAQVGVAAKQMQPALTRAFAATAPLVGDFMGAITDLAQHAMPGIVTALKNSQGAMAGFRSAMGMVGQGFGDMFRIITQGNEEELARAWVVLGNELRNLLESLGEFISTALNSGTATMLLIGIFRTFTGALNVVAGALKALDGISVGFFTNLADHISGFQGLDSTVSDSFKNSGKSIGQLKKELSDVNAEIKKVNSDAESLPGKPMEDYYRENHGYDDLIKKREGLLAALALAEQNNANAVQKSVTSYRDLVDAMQSLADLNRNYLDAQSAQQKAINDAKEKSGEYSNALKMNGKQLDLTTKAGQEAYEMLSQIASTTKESTDKAIEANAPWEQISKNWKGGYDQLVKLADGMGLSTEQAKYLATQILGMPPSKEIILKAKTEDAIASLDSVIAAMQAAPSSKEITVKTLSSDAIQLLQDIGFTVTQLPDGQFTITANTGTAKDNIDKVQAARDALKGKDITLSAKDRASGVADAIKKMVQRLTNHSFTITATHRTVFETVGSAPSTTADALRRQAEQFGASGGLAGSLPKKKFADGGSISGAVLAGPGTTTSDSLVARLSRGEFVMKAAAVQKYGVPFMTSVNQGRLRPPGFAKGGSVSKSEQEARNSARGDLTLSYFGKMAGFKRDEFVKALGLPESLGALVGELNKWRGIIKKSTHGLTEKRLLTTLAVGGKALIKYEKQLASVNKSLEKAKDKLADLKQQATQLKESVKQGIIGETNLTRSATADDSQVTLNTIMSQMTADSAQASQFKTSLEKLKKMGFSGAILEQIAQAGVSGGGLETATALLGSSPAQIKKMNQMNQSIRQSADDSGDVASSAMYGAGIKAAEGLVKGLQSKQKFIERQMLQLAQYLEKAIKKALGIKSPSKVMEKVGVFTAEGFALGIKKQSRVDSAVSNLVGSSTGPRSSSPGGKYGNQPMIIHLSLGGKDLGEVIIDPLRKAVSHRGGSVQAVLGS